MKKVKYEGPASVVQVMVDGVPQPHEKGKTEEYPDAVALELVESSKAHPERESFKAVKWSPKKLREELYPAEPEPEEEQEEILEEDPTEEGAAEEETPDQEPAQEEAPEEDPPEQEPSEEQTKK